jgi:hypothetical protein
MKEYPAWHEQLEQLMPVPTLSIEISSGYLAFKDDMDSIRPHFLGVYGFKGIQS